MSQASSTPDVPPPIGAAPDGQDFSHPWIISGIVSAICFVIGFVFMYTTGLWANFWQWADGPFLFYFAILTPVLIGFYSYGVYLLITALFRSKAKKS
ncbi:MAG TPA: hypothetical protein VEK08_19970 [Planctomycetota bacterium]|nr:hypothetical protein [Planctomycetota bacterium]